GEKLADRVHDQLSDIAARPELVRSFFRHQVSPIFLTYA
ncbi:IS630 family transposase, partial [Xanthomonas oryzae pv. oryzae]